MTAHALDRLRERFGIADATFDDVDRARLSCRLNETKLVRAAEHGRETHRLRIWGVRVWAIYDRPSNVLVTFVPPKEESKPAHEAHRDGRKARLRRLTLRAAEAGQ